MDKYYDITGHKIDSIKDVVESVITTYNKDSHRSLNNKTTNQVFKDDDEQQIKHIHDMFYT